MEYQGMTVRAAAFEVLGTGRFVVVATIVRTRVDGERREILLQPPSEDGLFDDQYEGIDAALSYARQVIDHGVAGFTVDNS